MIIPFNVHHLETKYFETLRSKVEDPATAKLFINKLICGLFLDKVSKTSGSIHPEAVLVARYGYSSSALSSLEIIRYLEMVKGDPRLTADTRKAIDTWISHEKDYLPLAIIFDGWRASHPRVQQILTKGRREQGLLEYLLTPAIQLTIPSQEMTVVAEAIAAQIAALKPGQEFRMLGGCDIHETRLLIRRVDEMHVDFFHYDTAAAPSTMVKYAGEKVSKFTADFWRAFIQLKFGEQTMAAMNRFVCLLGIRTNLTAEELLNAKSGQQTNSCPAQAVIAHLKHHLVRSSEEGLGQYKIVKSLMLQKAVRQHVPERDPELSLLLKSKAQIKERYLAWNELIADPEKWGKMEKLYLELIAMLKPSGWIYQMELIKGFDSKFLLLKYLDNLFTSYLRVASPEKIQRVLSSCAAEWPERQELFFLKHHQRMQKVKDLALLTRFSNNTISSQFIKLLRASSAFNKFGWTWLYEKAELYLRRGELSRKELRELGKEVFSSLALDQALAFLKNAFDQGLLKDSDAKDILYSLIDTENVSGVLGLAQLLLSYPFPDQLKNLCWAAVNPEKTHIFDGDTMALLKTMVLCNHRVQAIECMQQWMRRKIGRVSCGHTRKLVAFPQDWYIEALLGLLDRIKSLDTFEQCFYKMEILKEFIELKNVQGLHRIARLLLSGEISTRIKNFCLAIVEPSKAEHLPGDLYGIIKIMEICNHRAEGIKLLKAAIAQNPFSSKGIYVEMGAPEEWVKEAVDLLAKEKERPK